MFGDDAKLMRVVKNTDDCRELQSDIGKIDEWTKRWKLDFNAKKCRDAARQEQKNTKMELQDGVRRKYPRQKKEKTLGW